MQTCIKIIKFREKQLEDCILDLKKNIEGAIRQKSKILKRQPKWDGCNETLGGEVQDRLGLYQKDVLSKNSVNGGADEESGVESSLLLLMFLSSMFLGISENDFLSETSSFLTLLSQDFSF